MKIGKLITLGLIIAAVVVGAMIYLPIISQEMRFQTLRATSRTEIAPEVTPETVGFSLIIPKIGAEAQIFPNVDLLTPEDYLPVLAEGVAHALGTALPSGRGPILLFTHAEDSIFNITQYNTVFYLLNKLEARDEIFIYYQGKKYTYQVQGKKTIAPEDVLSYVEYLEDGTLVIQTCTPPGTTFNRLLVIAEEKFD